MPISIDPSSVPVPYFGYWRMTEEVQDLAFSTEPRVAIDEIFRALSDPTRREILRLLRSRDMTAGEIAERFPLAKSTLSGHFNVLKHAGLVVSERMGTSIVYSLNLAAYEEALAAVMTLLGVGKGRKERRG